jgi:hypothetical protein
MINNWYKTSVNYFWQMAIYVHIISYNTLHPTLHLTNTVEESWWSKRLFWGILIVWYTPSSDSSAFKRSGYSVIPDFFQKSQLFSSHQTWSSHPFMKIYPNYLQSIHPAIKPLRSGSMHICPNKNHWKKAKTPALQQMFVLNKKNMGWVPSSLWYRWFHEGFNRTWRCLFVEVQFLLGQSQTARLFFSFNPDVPLVLPVFSWSISYLDSQFPSVLYPPLVTV